MASASSKDSIPLNAAPDSSFESLPQNQTDAALPAPHSSAQTQESSATQREPPASGNRYARYYELYPLAYFTLDAEGFVRECNLSAVQLLGYEREGLPGQVFLQLVSQRDQAAFNGFFGQLSGGGQNPACQLALRAKGGEERPIRLQGRKLETEGAQTEYLLVAVETQGQPKADPEQAILPGSEARWQKAMSIPTVGVIFFNPEGSINDANAAFERMSGFSREAFTSGKVRWEQLTPPECMEAMLRSREECLTRGENTPYQKQCIRSDGSRWWGLFAGKRLSETECMEFVLDITESKRAEAALRQLSQELAAATAELRVANEELSAANEEIKTSNEEISKANGLLCRVNAELDNFIYTASHDLKAPILNIEGLMKVLSRKALAPTGQEDQLSHILALMEQSITRFKETIRDLTDIARIEKQLDVKSEPVALQEIVEDTLLDLAPQVAESAARIERDLEACPSILFSRKNLKSVVYNLLSNALKYRDPSRTPHVTIACQPQGDYLVLEVGDNGLGMDTTHPDRIFGMFKRQHAHVEGTGVGLYIIKKMIENAGGKIEVESKVGEGAIFRVYFKR